MTPMERLYAEELPTGTFGGTRTPAPPGREITPEQTTANYRALANALDRPRHRRHLHAAPDQEAAA